MDSEPTPLVNLIKKENKLLFSFEVTPAVSKEEIDNLEVDPTFFSVTWHAKSHKCKDLDIEPLKIAIYLKSKQKQVLVHLSCDLMRKDYLEKVLIFLHDNGICNLFLVLGESYDPESSDFKSTLDLIKCIRELWPFYFCIGVAGFCDSSEDKLSQLKEKVDAGANFIITQAFFEPNAFKTYVEKCDKIAINVPIIPGVFAFENLRQLIHFTNMCKVKVSDDLLEFVKKNEGRDVAGVEIVKNLVQTLRSTYPTVNFHFFTLNKLKNVCSVIRQIKN